MTRSGKRHYAVAIAFRRAQRLCDSLVSPTVTPDCTNFVPGANLAECDLTGADLAGANLQKADLTDAILTDADLFSATLSGATLSGATLTDAYLVEADLTGVIWWNTICPDGITIANGTPCP